MFNESFTIVGERKRGKKGIIFVTIKIHSVLKDNGINAKQSVCLSDYGFVYS